MVVMVQRRHIMVIDDSPTICSIIKNALLREGYEATSFTDEIEALSALANVEMPIPDLVFLDIKLKQIDGYAIARMFRQKDEMRQTIIVMMSGLHDPFNRWRGQRAGAKAFLVKPFRTDDIINAVRTLLGPPILIPA